MSIIRIPRQSRFSYGNRLSKRILKSRRAAPTSGELTSHRQLLAANIERVRDTLSSARTWFWIVAALLFGSILHIISVLVLPEFATKSAWARLLPLSPVNVMRIFPQAPPAPNILPFLGPDVRYALCRFNLTESPVKVRTPFMNPLWSVAIYNRDGDNFYTISGADLQRSEAQIVLMNETQRPVIEEDEGPGSDDVITVVSKDQEGLIIIRAPIPGKNYATQTDALIQQSDCNPHS